jgi:drug/metabolite transporter (DMT)-like permease
MWLLVVIISQFANAGSMFLDKLLIAKKFPRPGVLTFVTALSGLVVLPLIFWDFNWQPTFKVLVLSLVAGICFTIALQFFYMALKTGEATHISPLVGAVVPIGSLILSYVLLAEKLSNQQYLGVAILVVGALLISMEKSRRHHGWHIGMVWAVIAGLFFAGYYVLSRVIYLQDTFSTGFVWGRLGSVLAVLPLLLFPTIRQDLFTSSRRKKQQRASGFGWLAVNKLLAAGYFLGMNFAISLTSATLVNALAGLQYVMLFIIMLWSSRFSSRFEKEEFSRMEIITQVFALIIIVVGIALLI